MSPGSGGAAGPRVALVHDYFTQRGGAERVAERVAGLFAGTRVYASVVDDDALPPSLDRRSLATTPLQHLRRAGVPLQALAPVLPAAFGGLDLGRPDVVISSSSAFAHHIRPGLDSVHVCYCHTPPRFLWEADEYFRERPLLGRLGAPSLGFLRARDAAAADRVGIYLANSAFTAQRIRRAYGRSSRVVYPPIATDAFRPGPERSGRFLVVARLRRHKRIDLAIAAAGRLDVPLDVIGEGSDLAWLRELAGPTVRFLGRLSDDDVAAAMARCAGLIVPGIEDFGMTTAEVQAAGRPPIAFAGGGSLEIVDDGRTGFLFDEASVDGVVDGLRRALREPLDPAALVASAARFDARIFDAAIRGVVADAIADPRAAAIPSPSRSGDAVGTGRAAAVRDPAS